MTAYQPLFLMSCHSLIFVQGQVVHSSEGVGDTDIHWTDFCAVGGHGRKAADQCIKCGKCESVCPQHIAIRKNLEVVAENLLAK